VIAIVVSTYAVAVSVTVTIPLRCGPEFGATANTIVPSPAPDAPWVIEMNATLLTAPQAQLGAVFTEMDAEPPAAENVVVVLPVMTWHPPELGYVVDEQRVPPKATATSKMAEKNTRVRGERSAARNRFMVRFFSAVRRAA